MATKLNAATAKRVKALKINAKNEEEAKSKLLEILENNGIEGMEEEDIDTLLDIAESISEDDNDSPASEEDENDELAKEVEDEDEAEEEEAPKKTSKKTAPAKKKVEEPEEEDEEEDEDEAEDEADEEGDGLDDLDRNELKKFIKENGLEVSVKKSMSEGDIVKAIREAMSSEDEDEEEDEAEEETLKKSSKKTAVPAKKEEKKKAETSAKKEKAPSKRGVKLDFKNNEKDRAIFKEIEKLFPKDEYEYSWLSNAGVTLKYRGKNSMRSVLLIENCTKHEDGSIKCNLYLMTLTKKLDVLEANGIDFEKCWTDAPMIKGILFSEVVEIIQNLFEDITSDIKKIDKKLGENRKKMEEGLEKKSSKKTVAAPAKKKVEEPEEEDEDEDEEEEAPKKTSKKPAPAKKALTKKK